MKESNALDALTRIAGLAVLVGVVVLAAAIAAAMALTWDASLTKTVVGGGIAVCGGSAVVVALVVGLFVGLGVYRRMTDRPPAPPAYDPGRSLPSPYREETPPQLKNVEEGEWRRPDASAYDLALWGDRRQATFSRDAPSWEDD